MPMLKANRINPLATERRSRLLRWKSRTLSAVPCHLVPLVSFLAVNLLVCASKIALAGPVAAPSIDLALCIDGSGSISSSDFELQRLATASAIEDARIVPQDGSVRITVIQFATTVQNVVLPTIIDSPATAVAVADQVDSMTQLGSGTNLGGCIERATELILNEVSEATNRVIDVSTDGNPTEGPDSEEAAAAAEAAGIDVINAIGVGNANVSLLEAIAFPKPVGGARGFVAYVDDFVEYVERIGQKIELEVAVDVPTILVHGFCSDTTTWRPTVELLRNSDVVSDVDLYSVPYCYTSANDNEHDDCNALTYDGSEVTTVGGRSGRFLSDAAAGDLYLFRLQNPTAPNPLRKTSVNDVRIEEAAYQLGRVVERVLSIEGTSKVNLVGHSMGGLISRAYVQGLAQNASGLTLPYDGTVRKIVTLDSPHQGSIGSLFSLIDPLDIFSDATDCVFESSTQKDQMRASSSFLEGLNARAVPEDVKIVSIAATNRDPRPFESETDDVVSGRSQDLTTVSTYKPCLIPGSGSVSAVRRTFWGGPGILHNDVFGFDSIVRDLDYSLFPTGELSNRADGVVCREIEALTNFEIASIITGVLGRVLIDISPSLFRGLVGSKGQQSCEAEIVIAQPNKSPIEQSVRLDQGPVTIEIPNLSPETDTTVSLRPTCDVLIQDATVTANGQNRLFSSSFELSELPFGTPIPGVEPNELTVSIDGTGAGIVTSQPARVECPGRCSAFFEADTTVVLTATAEQGSVFDGWGGACSGTDTCELTMTQAQAVTASFIVDENDGGPLVNETVFNGDISFIGDEDTYTFDVTAGESAHIRVVDTSGDGNFEPQYQLYAPDDSLVRTTWNEVVAALDCYSTAPGSGCRLEQSGTYRLVVTDYNDNGTGAYEIHYARVLQANENGPLVADGVVSGDITLGDIDAFTFEATAGESIHIRAADATGSNFSPQIWLYAPDGRLVRWVWNRTVAALDCLPNATCSLEQSGTYRLVVMDYDTNDVGSYQIHYTRVSEADENGPLIADGVVSGDITLGDIDTFTFEATAGESAYIRVSDTSGNGALSPLIWLHAPDGSLVRSVWSRTVASLDCLPNATCSLEQSGTYRLVVMDYDTNDVGSYQISYTQVPPTSQ